MISIIKRLLKLAGYDAKRIKLAFVISILEGIFSKVPIMLVLYMLVRITEGNVVMQDAWTVGIAIILSVLLTALCRRLVDQFQSGTGFEMLAKERMKIGDHLKRLPMGYFSEGNIGNVTAVITSDLVFIEEHSMRTLSKIVTGYISMFIGIIMLSVLDIRIGMISLVTVLIASIALMKIQKVGAYHSAIRQETQSNLVSAVLEYVKGITVIKSFNMVGDRGDKIKNEFRRYRDTSIDFEEKFVPPLRRFESIFSVGIGIIILAATYFAFDQTLDKSFMLVTLIFAFQIFTPFKILGDITGMIRIMEVALNRYEAIKNEQIIDKHGKDMTPQTFDIAFKDVSFAYEKEKILHHVTFDVPEQSMTALVGKSGCGKSTIANLVARFWDIQEGVIQVGGIDIKKMTCDSLLKHMSMVFQNVYLFQDTILNNITFGKPHATMEEVYDVCKKARCHDFIMALEDGYDTLVGEGGSSLSGGEKQRISIARAILKDAPIILLDEATASVDPDNEKHIQLAINELVKDKTLIVIAHRLSTIKNADQILVIDEGKIMQRGTHQELIDKQGAYQDFWQRRTKASSWKISKAMD